MPKIMTYPFEQDPNKYYVYKNGHYLEYTLQEYNEYEKLRLIELKQKEESREKIEVLGNRFKVFSERVESLKSSSYWKALGFSEKDTKRFCVSFESKEDFDLAKIFLLRSFSSLKGLNFSDVLRTINKNISQYKQPDFLSLFRIPGYKFDLAEISKTHVETGIQINISDLKLRDRTKKHELGGLPEKINPIATFGIELLSTSVGVQLRVINLQGGRAHAKILLERLNRVLGMNWRIWVVRKLMQYANSKGYRTVGILPPRFISVEYLRDFGESPTLEEIERYKRILRQYIQTFSQAGLKPEDLDYSQISKEVTGIKERVARRVKVRLSELRRRRDLRLKRK